MGYEWLSAGLSALGGIEPYEVMYVLNSKVPRPMPATGPDGHWVMTIWGRTAAGRGLIVAVRPLSQWDWQIIGAREMRVEENARHQAWEAKRDDQ